MLHLSKLKLKYFIPLFFSTATLCARESFDNYLFAEAPQHPQAWFTGPLLTPSGHVVPLGHQNYEPYIYWTQTTGEYNSNWAPHSRPTFNNVFFQTLLQFGVLPKTEFDIFPQFTYNETRGEHRWRVSDLPILLNFQLLYDHVDNWAPGIKIKIGANIPLGKYDNLKENLYTTDAGGVGSWFPSFGVVFARMFHISGIHYLPCRLFLNYSIGTPVNVRGKSVYGGVKQTRGTVYPGNVFLVLASLEYSLSQNWALALDIEYQHTNKNRFSGRTPPGTKPVFPSRERFALAPAIEYNWNPNLGIIAGPWFTVAGRNSRDFISYVIAFNVYH